VRGGIEPPNRAFAELGLTTWLPHRESERGTWANFPATASTEIQMPNPGSHATDCTDLHG
jgi:hypothetical protein